ncbi:MAG: transcription termination/antitermination protein NusG [Candidatus Fimivivens sp.]
MMQWYVLHVLTGRDDDVQQDLAGQGIECLILMENRMIRRGGRWRQEPYRLMPGYVFVHIEFDDNAYHLLNQSPGVIRILSTGGKPSPLPEHEVKWLVWSSGELLEPSVIRYLDNYTYAIESGVLRTLKDKIVSIDRHRRRVKVKLDIAGHPHMMELSYKLSTGF